MLQLLTVFLSEGWSVTYASTANKSNNSIDLTDLGIDEKSVELNNSNFDEFLKNLNPSIVVFDRFMTEEQFGWRVAETCPKALRILDTEDIHSLRKVRQHCVEKNIEFSNELLLQSDIAKREIASMYRCDLSLIISSYEMDLLTKVFKIDENLLLHLPFLLEPISDEEIKDWKSFEEKNHFVSIGNFLHPPNLDATRLLKKEIWAKIRKKLPKAELHIYGAYPTQEILQYNKPLEGFFVHGYAESATEVISNARVLLAPLRFGAGIKGKLTDAMLCGTPTITTDFGAEGMHSDLPWSGFITSIDNFTEKAIELYSNKDIWIEAQTNGKEIIKQLYDKNILAKKIIDSIENILKNLENHRINNFIGSMLMHHSAKSTKYLSKWIEEKNKKQLD